MDCNYFKEFVLDASKYNILILENSKITLNLIKNSFKPYSYTLYYANSALQAKAMMEELNIHYLIVNGNISLENDFELLEYIKNSGVKTFLLTTEKTGKTDFYYKNGIVDCLNKNNNFEFEIKQFPQMIEQIERNKSRSILLIEKNSTDSNELKTIFKNRNYDVILEKNSTKVLELLRVKKIDLLLLNLDYDNTAMDFIVQNKRYLFDELKICVLFMTENISNSIVRDSLKIGVADVIKTPYIIEEVILKVDRHINNKIESEKLICSTQLLQQYKQTVDRSSIVSKTDPKGVITYVNEAFCRISGYKEEELLGKPHNLVRHPDMKASVFKEMWDTIKKRKEPWIGEVKNRKKDGSSYWVQTIINPILDANGKILEYIGIRQDISQVVELHEELEATQREIVYKMGEIGETRSKETGNHVKRVAEYSKLLAELYGLSSKEAEILFTASPMHDIGKVGIPDAILNKPGALTSQEWKIMKTHSVIGYNILKNSKREVLKAAAIVAREHHEKWDGSGYPRKLKGEKIHIFGRITAIADVFDALGSDRCYKKAWKDEKIFQLLIEEKGKHFDPTLVDLFMNNVNEFKKIRDKYKD